ncbi:hypothetical protein [Nocardia sp. R6R-6]|uniref:hypothetical protein n=1 Tax=Nocardia sp. R6R-6 TaxID=3459303 RepID=UPI00403D9691
MDEHNGGTTGSSAGNGPEEQLRQLLAPRVRTHLGETTARVVYFTVRAAILYAVLAGGFALSSTLPNTPLSRIDIQLVIDHNEGTALLGLFVTVVIALHVVAWWLRTANPQPQPATGLSPEEYDARAALYARHLVMSQAASLCGVGAIVVGLSSFVDAVALKGKLLTGVAILLVAIVIAIFSLDAEAGLRDGKDLEAEVRRDRNAAELRRLRRLVGSPADGSPGPEDPSARWSDARTAAPYPNAWKWLWWVREIAGILLMTLAIPTAALTYASRSSGTSWGEILSSMVSTLGLVLLIDALFVTMIVATMAALIFQHRVIAAAYALSVTALLATLTVAMVSMFFDGTAITADRVITVVSGLGLFWAPVVITLRAFAINPVRSGRFVGGAVRRLIRVTILCPHRYAESRWCTGVIVVGAGWAADRLATAASALEMARGVR